MKIVIDIPEEEYGRMKEQSMFGRVDVWKQAIKNGTPLPKGHGRLIDADVLKTAFPCGESVRTECIRGTINYAPTIIKADKEESEDKRTEERTETHACDCISREAAVDEILREVETLRCDVRELKELLGYIRKYGVASDSTPEHIGQRFCEIVDGWEGQDG